MTNSQFDKWLQRHFRSNNSAAKALGLSWDTVASLRSGATRKGAPCPVPAYIALACEAWSRRVRDYDGTKALVEESA